MRVLGTRYVCDFAGCQNVEFAASEDQMAPYRWTFLKLWTVGDSPDVSWDKCFCPEHGNLVCERVDGSWE